MSIREIIDEVLRSSTLMLQQEFSINKILREKDYNLSDLEALDELVEAILRQEVKAAPDSCKSPSDTQRWQGEISGEIRIA
ncbi:hypothetical protein [Synechococcus sp. RC10A2]|uniref:hypothetical protein n=1 Tax=Synechococcus sp. RC10A2 TaxID=2964529 RepID=UPI0039C6BDB9